MEHLRGQSSRVGLVMGNMNAGTCLFWSVGLEVGICDPGAVDSRLEQTCRGVYVDKLGSQLVSWCFEPSQP